MALLTLQEAKDILQLDDTLDTTIIVLLPLLINQVVYSICQNRFINPKVTMTSSTLTFSGSAGTIVDSQSQFILEDFYTLKQDFVVGGSLYNDGLYEAATVSAATLTLDLSTMTKGFKDEAEGEYIEVKQVVFPDDLKLTTAKWLNYILNKSNLQGVKSESVLSYSVSYINDVPPDVLREFRYYRKSKFC